MKKKDAEQITVAEAIISFVEKQGAEYVFGVPGSRIEQLNTALYKSKIQVIVSSHEQGAAFIADGYARVSGRLGVCTATAGPGASNLLSGMMPAYCDGIPVLALTGQIPSSKFGWGSIQEASPFTVDVFNMFRQTTNFAAEILSEESLPVIFHRSSHMLQFGPVCWSLPVDIADRCISKVEMVSALTRPAVDSMQVQAVADILIKSARPAILAGWGVCRSRAANELRALAEILNVPVITAPIAKGVFPEDHQLSLGVFGFAGSKIAEEYLRAGVSDLLIIGHSLNEMATNGWQKLLKPTGEMIYCNLTPYKVGAYSPTKYLLGDARKILASLGEEVFRITAQKGNGFHATKKERLDFLEKIRQFTINSLGESETRLYHPGQLIRDIQKFAPESTIYFADIGTALAWSIQELKIKHPYSFFVSLGYGGMGHALAASIGGKLALPERTVVAFVGDGAMLMNGAEFHTAVQYKIPIIWVVLNNSMYGLVYHGRKLSAKNIPEGIPSKFNQVNFAQLADAYGGRGIRISSPSDLSQDLFEEILSSKVPTILDVLIEPEVVPPIHSRIKTLDENK